MLALLSFGCSSDGSEAATGDGFGGTSGDGSGGAGAGTGGGAAFHNQPCPSADRVGGFGIQVQAAAGTAQLAGAVNDKVSPSDVWQPVAEDGACQVIVKPSQACAVACANLEECDGTRCVPSPAGQDVGRVSVSGLAAPVSADALPNDTYYAPIASYPPFAPGDAVTLTAAGARYQGFSLRGVGIEALEVPATVFEIVPGEPLSLSWTPPSVAGSSRMGIALDIAHHGNVGARLVCDVPDTGAHTVSAELLTELVDRGVAGFPLVNFIRRTIDSTATELGCVDFAVASSMERELTLPGLTSCRCPPGAPCEQCPSDLTCQMDFTCR